MKKKLLTPSLTIFIILILIPTISSFQIPEDSLIKNPDDIPKIAQNNSNNFFEEEINIQEKSEILSRVILGPNSKETINKQELIVLTILTFIMIITIKNMLDFSPSFRGILSILTSITLTGIILLTGFLINLSLNLLNFFENFPILKEIILIKILFISILIVLIFAFINLIIGLLKETIIKQKSVSDGLKVGAQLATLRAMADIENATRGI
ncbi:MAG: hypothetical protein ACOCV1_07690 [Bacillota bacterium]